MDTHYIEVGHHLFNTLHMAPNISQLVEILQTNLIKSKLFDYFEHTLLSHNR